MFLLELVIDLIMDCWFWLMQWIVPDKALPKGARIALKAVVGICSCILLFLMIMGICMLFSDDPYVTQIGRYLVFVPLAVSAVQILLGILVRAATKKK